MLTLLRHLALTAAALAIGIPAASAQSPLDPPVSGAEAYRTYCAGCHGRSGKGDGPVAGSLRQAPPDLSGLAARNNGAFPRQRVKGAILNVERPVSAHATGEMPVWAHVFSAVEPDAARLERRIDDLVGFVETLQEPMLATLEAGRALYAAHCAVCHGATGQGGAAPDLTGYAMRNGGMFPAERIGQIVDGRGVAAHGPRSMPVWGDAFRGVPGDRSPAAAAVRVAAITRFLESIQLRASH